ncbi:MAG: polyphosphate kinase 2 [Coriobacteriia bacterium]|nr:polyphosphate kinase 2 [Coriobacteriia bacterium]MBN2840480.1 polyphosphate kinase 2 [Coriobacteriia bacterium]
MGKHEGKKDRAAEEAYRAYADDPEGPKPKKIDKETYERELEKLQLELVKLQQWVKQEGLRVVVVFEGRDAAGKGGVIKRITEALNPRTCKVVALPVPTEREITQWYFQRYIAHLPAAGEIVLFDRSWYNRAVIERVMGWATEEQVQEFFRDCPDFERMLKRSGVILIKYWLSISDEEQDRRFQDRIDDPMKSWKFSAIDLDGRDRWEDFSRAKDEMFKYTDTKESPWWVVEGDVKKRARLNCIHHLLTQIPYEDVLAKPFKLPPRKQSTGGYVRPPIDSQTYVPEVY